MQEQTPETQTRFSILFLLRGRVCYYHNRKLLRLCSLIPASIQHACTSIFLQVRDISPDLLFLAVSPLRTKFRGASIRSAGHALTFDLLMYREQYFFLPVFPGGVLQSIEHQLIRPVYSFSPQAPYLLPHQYFLPSGRDTLFRDAFRSATFLLRQQGKCRHSS